MGSSGAITGVAEIVLSVKDLPVMRRFYEDVLGFPLLSQAAHTEGMVADAEGEPTIAFLTIRELSIPLGRHCHPQLLVLIDYQRHVFAKASFDGHDPRRSTLNQLAFEIDPKSYDGEAERLERLDLAPRRTVFPAMQAKALFFKDPEGNTLELICHDPVP